MISDHPDRGPLWAIILATAGQDVRTCMTCWVCEKQDQSGKELSIGEMMRAITRDDPSALSYPCLWEPHTQEGHQCQEGIDIAAVLNALRDEAELRGHTRGNQQVKGAE